MQIQKEQTHHTENIAIQDIQASFNESQDGQYRAKQSQAYGQYTKLLRQSLNADTVKKSQSRITQLIQVHHQHFISYLLNVVTEINVGHEQSRIKQLALVLIDRIIGSIHKQQSLMLINFQPVTQDYRGGEQGSSKEQLAANALQAIKQRIVEIMFACTSMQMLKQVSKMYMHLTRNLESTQLEQMLKQFNQLYAQKNTKLHIQNSNTNTQSTKNLDSRLWLQCTYLHLCQELYQYYSSHITETQKLNTTVKRTIGTVMNILGNTTVQIKYLVEEYGRGRNIPINSTQLASILRNIETGVDVIECVFQSLVKVVRAVVEQMMEVATCIIQGHQGLFLIAKQQQMQVNKTLNRIVGGCIQIIRIVYQKMYMQGEFNNQDRSAIDQMHGKYSQTVIVSIGRIISNKLDLFQLYIYDHIAQCLYSMSQVNTHVRLLVMQNSTNILLNLLHHYIVYPESHVCSSSYRQQLGQNRKGLVRLLTTLLNSHECSAQIINQLLTVLTQSGVDNKSMSVLDGNTGNMQLCLYLVSKIPNILTAYLPKLVVSCLSDILSMNIGSYALMPMLGLLKIRVAQLMTCEIKWLVGNQSSVIEHVISCIILSATQLLQSVCNRSVNDETGNFYMQVVASYLQLIMQHILIKKIQQPHEKLYNGLVMQIAKIISYSYEQQHNSDQWITQYINQITQQLSRIVDYLPYHPATIKYLVQHIANCYASNLSNLHQVESSPHRQLQPRQQESQESNYTMDQLLTNIICTIAHQYVQQACKQTYSPTHTSQASLEWVGILIHRLLLNKQVGSIIEETQNQQMLQSYIQIMNQVCYILVLVRLYSGTVEHSAVSQQLKLNLDAAIRKCLFLLNSHVHMQSPLNHQMHSMQEQQPMLDQFVYDGDDLQFEHEQAQKAVPIGIHIQHNIKYSISTHLWRITVCAALHRLVIDVYRNKQEADLVRQIVVAVFGVEMNGDSKLDMKKITAKISGLNLEQKQTALNLTCCLIWLQTLQQNAVDTLYRWLMQLVSNPTSNGTDHYFEQQYYYPIVGLIMIRYPTTTKPCKYQIYMQSLCISLYKYATNRTQLASHKGQDDGSDDQISHKLDRAFDRCNKNNKRTPMIKYQQLLYLQYFGPSFFKNTQDLYTQIDKFVHSLMLS